MPIGRCAAPGRLRPSYIACGPIHPTGAKAMPWIPQGNANLAYWCALLPLPVVAIGGMDVARASQAMRCGAAGVAVISAITAAASPETAIAELSAGNSTNRSGTAYVPASGAATIHAFVKRGGPCSARC